MGFPNNSHIKKFVSGQVIDDITEDRNGAITLLFKNGESLRLWPRVKEQRATLETIATPLKANGEAKQTTEI